MKIYLVRHGQTSWNQQCRYQGTKDIPLDEEGISQVEKLAERLKDVAWDGATSSDLNRAKTTAEIILQHQPKTQLHLYPELQEMNFGAWEGITFSEADKKWPNAVSSFFADPTQPIIPEGENAVEFRDRVLRGFDQVLSLAEDSETWLVATHGGVIRIILCEVLGVPLKEMWDFHQGNTALNILSINNGQMKFDLINDTTHLK